MTTRFENKLTMYLAVKMVCETYAAIIAMIPQFAAYFAEFTNIIALINANRMKQEADIKGFAIEKNSKRTIASQEAISIANKLTAYAAVTDNHVLEQKVNFTKNEWNISPDTQFIEKALIVHVEATAHIADLAPYNITQPMLDTFIASINAYSDILIDPRNAIAERKTATSNIANLFSQADSILYDKMDKLIEVVAETQPEFCSNYLNARIIVDLGHREISLEGKILDAATTVPIRNAKVELLEAGKQIITAKTGGYRFKSLPGGNYTLRISMQNYRTQIIQNIPIIEGKMYIRNVMLERGDEQFAILPNTDIIAWYGSPDSNLLITVKNTSTIACDIWTYITVNPSDPMPADKITLHSQQQHQYRLADFQPAETIYLHLKNPDTLQTAQYLLIFENEMQ